MIKTHLKRVLVGCILGLGGAVLLWRSQTRVYESSVQMFVNSSNNRSLTEMSELLSTGLIGSMTTEASFIKSEGTFKQAVLNVSQRRNDTSLTDPDTLNELYLLFDIGMAQNSRVMSATVRAYNPQVAADIANEIVAVYNKKRKESSVGSYTNAQYTIREQLTIAKNSLDASEKRLLAFKKQLGGTDLGTRATDITSTQLNLEKELQGAKNEDVVLGKTLDAVRAKIPLIQEKKEIELALGKNPVLSGLEMQLANMEQQRTQLLMLYTPTSAKIKEQDELIERTKKLQYEAQKDAWQKTSRTWQLDPVRMAFESQVAQGNIQLVTLRARQRSLSKALAIQSAKLAALPDQERKLAELTRDHDLFYANYKRFKGQLTELQLQSATNYLPAVVIYPAQPNDKAISPQPGKTLPIGLIVGGIFGLLYGFLRESLRSTARTSDEISSLFELPVVATVPTLSDIAVRRKLLGLPQRTFAPQESFRFMASAAALAQRGPRSVVFTSSGGNVGCSSAAGEFAVAASKMGVRTILVDADTTFGTLTKAFKMTDKPGLRDLLGRKLLATEDVPLTIATDHPHLSVLPIGGDTDVEISDTPNSLLQGLLVSLHEQAELVVIDCPPIDVMADTSRFVSLASEVCLVVSTRNTNLQAISLAKVLLERCGASVVNVVLTGTQTKDEAFNEKNRYMAARR